VIKPGGKLLIRTASRETIDSYLWASFFPEGANIEASRVLSRAAIRDLLSASSFTLDAELSVVQLFAKDLRDYCERISQRALSSLQAIPDSAFERGMVALRKHCETASRSVRYTRRWICTFSINDSGYSGAKIQDCLKKGRSSARSDNARICRVFWNNPTSTWST